MFVIKLPVPVLTLILAATAIPIAFRPLQPAELLPFSIGAYNIDPYDIVANIAGFVPVGIVLAALGPMRAMMAAALLSISAETSQLVMLYRSPSLIDVVTNILGTMLGVSVAARYNLKPQLTATGWIGTVATALALLLILGAWVMFGEGIGDRGRTTPGTGSLEAHWTFDESSGQLARDVSGHGLNGKYNNQPTKTAGPIGNAVTFGGTADYIDLGRPTALRLTSSLTISAWIRSTHFPRDDAVIVSNQFKKVGFQLDTTVDKGPRTIGFKLTNSCGAMMARYGTTPLALDTWYYVTGVYDAKAKTIDVYLNGKLDNGFLAGAVMGSQKSSLKNIYIGRSDSNRFTGEIDDVRIYSLPLTKAEISADMQAHGPALPQAAHANNGRDLTGLDQNDACSGSPDPDAEKIPVAAVALGVLVAIACAGLFPSSGTPLCLIVSLVAGLLFASATASTLPLPTRWVMPLLSMTGALSVAFTMRRHNAQKNRA